MEFVPGDYGAVAAALHLVSAVHDVCVGIRMSFGQVLADLERRVQQPRTGRCGGFCLDESETGRPLNEEIHFVPGAVAVVHVADSKFNFESAT